MKKTYKIKEIVKQLQKDDSLFFQPDNPWLGVIGVNFEGGINWYDSYGNARPIEHGELDQEICGRYSDCDM